MKLAEARAQCVLAQSAHRAALVACEAAAAQRTGITLDEAAQAYEPAITALLNQYGLAEQARRDLPDCFTLRATAHAKRDELLQEIGGPALIPPVAAAASARDAITRHAGLASKVDAARNRALENAQALADLERDAPDAVAVAPDLAALVDEIRVDRQPAQHAAKCAEAVRAAASALASALVQIPGWGGDADGLRALSPADDEHYERLDTALHARMTVAQQAAKARDETGQKLAAVIARFDALHGQELPDAAAVRAARALRDRGWGLIGRRLSGDPDLDGELGYAGGQTVALVFDRQLRTADALADRRLD